MRPIRIRPLPLLQIFDVRLVIPRELRTPKHGYDVIGTRFIGEIAAGRVVHPRHEHIVVTMPLVTDLAPRRPATILTSVNRLMRIPSLLSFKSLASPQPRVKTCRPLDQWSSTQAPS